MESSQTRSVWNYRQGVVVLKGQWKSAQFSTLLSGRYNLSIINQTLRVWLLSGCAAGTIVSVVVGKTIH
jgi:hypothetical protein